MSLRCGTPAAPNLCGKSLLQNLADDASTDGAIREGNRKAHTLLDREACSQDIRDRFE